jgi:hypothetical protein
MCKILHVTTELHVTKLFIYVHILITLLCLVTCLLLHVSNFISFFFFFCSERQPNNFPINTSETPATSVSLKYQTKQFFEAE